MIATKRSSGFALPTVLIASIVMTIVLFAAVTSTAAMRVSMAAQYYNSMAKNAADAGASFAKACLNANNDTPLWNATGKPLKPGTDCSGNAVTSCPGGTTTDACYVTYDSTNNIRSSYTVGAAAIDSLGHATNVNSYGSVQLFNASSQAVWRQYNQSTQLNIIGVTSYPWSVFGVFLVGGGGGGGSYNYGGGGGGGQINIGGYVASYYAGIINVTVGPGGAAGSNLTGQGGTGGTTSFGTYLYANGGGGGGGGATWNSAFYAGGNGPAEADGSTLGGGGGGAVQGAAVGLGSKYSGATMGGNGGGSGSGWFAGGGGGGSGGSSYVGGNALSNGTGGGGAAPYHSSFGGPTTYYGCGGGGGGQLAKGTISSSNCHNYLTDGVGGQSTTLSGTNGSNGYGDGGGGAGGSGTSAGAGGSGTAVIKFSTALSPLPVCYADSGLTQTVLSGYNYCTFTSTTGNQYVYLPPSSYTYIFI